MIFLSKFKNIILLYNMEKNNSKQYLLLAVLLIIVFLVLGNAIKNWNKSNIYNYDSENFVGELIPNSYVIKERETYYILEDIIINYISSYNSKDNYNEEITYKDYYYSLDDLYKEHLNKKEYYALSEDFLKDFYMLQNVESNSELQYRGILKKVRKIMEEKDSYLCEVKLDNMQSTRYIGIKLDVDSETFKIFYIE